ncbi:Lysine methyltransferase, partial [Rhizoctonia solani]
MQPYTWLNYFAWKYPSRAVTSKVYFWYGFVFIFDGAGMWMSAFGTLYATLLPRVLLGSERKVSFLLHPILLNFMCFAMPALLTITQLITASLSQAAWSKAVNLQFDLIEDLWTLSGQWLATNGETVDPSLRQQVSVEGNTLISAFVDSRSAFVRNAWAAAAWYFLCMLLFSPTAIWLLVTLKRAAGHLTQSSRSGSTQNTPSLGPNTGAFPQRVGPPVIQPNTTREQNKQKKALRRAYVTAALQFIATFVCLMVAVGSFIWVSIDIDRVATNPVAHAVAILISDWILAVVGTIINILIIIRMSSQVEAAGSHQESQHTRLRSLSNAHTMMNRPTSPSHSDLEIEKPIPLHTISTHQNFSDLEFGSSYKAPLSSNGGHSCKVREAQERSAVPGSFRKITIIAKSALSLSRIRIRPVNSRRRSLKPSEAAYVLATYTTPPTEGPHIDLSGDLIGHSTSTSSIEFDPPCSLFRADTNLTVVEVGSGTGYGGIHLAQQLSLFRRCHDVHTDLSVQDTVILTDLPSVVPLLYKGLEEHTGAFGQVQVQAQALAWGDVGHAKELARILGELGRTLLALTSPPFCRDSSPEIIIGYRIRSLAKESPFWQVFGTWFTFEAVLVRHKINDKERENWVRFGHNSDTLVFVATRRPESLGWEVPVLDGQLMNGYGPTPPMLDDTFESLLMFGIAEDV